MEGDVTFSGRAFASLRRLRTFELPEERCNSCATALRPAHSHLVDCTSRRVLCICDVCAMMLAKQSETRFRAVPSTPPRAPDIHVSEAQWSALSIPVGLAFIYTTDGSGQVYVMYPSPTGPIVSEVERESWSDIVRSNHILQSLKPYVEAFLVNRIGRKPEYLLAPIDECYRLAGLVRRGWRGFSGGADLQEEVSIHLQELRRRAITTV
jgi:hypothetical protein